MHGLWYNNIVKLFDIKFGNNLEGAEELFVKGGEYCAADGSLTLKAGESASFETYFNLFPHQEYAEYCGIKSVFLELKAQGRYRIDFFEQRKSGKMLLKSYIAEGDCAAECNLTGAHEGGYTYFTLTAESDCSFYRGAWVAAKAPERRVKIAVVICTYNREQYVRANVMRVATAMDADPDRKELLHLYIIDNAGNLELESGDFYTVVRNRNLGGAGGFARGMYEAAKDKSFTHILLMDDDIYFDFTTLDRTCRLLGALTEKHKNASVGGAMLVMDKPYIQYEFGGYFDGLIFRSLNHKLDVRRTESLLKNQNAPKPNYNAWWYCCMPASCVKEHGLPMPFFIKSDDVEYGMRAMDELILTSGLAVWHQDFGAKYTGTLEYYIKRNGAVAAALRMPTGSLKAAIRYAYFMFKNLSLKNYDCVELIYKAYLDFRAGSNFFLTADSADMNDEIRAHAQKFTDEAELAKVCGKKPELPEVRREKRHSLAACFLMFAENYMPAFLFSKKVGVTNAGIPRAWDCFMKKTVVHYDPYNGKGLVLKLDTKRRRKLRRLTYKVFFGLLFNYGKIKKDYRKNWQKMCSEENWCRMFFKNIQN